jgi:hypothetical protein
MMAVKTDVVFESDTDLQAFLSAGLYLPNLRIWCEVPKEDWESKCDSALGDGRKLMSTQFYGVERDEKIYAVVGRNEVVNDKPTGNFKTLEREELYAWVNKYGSEAMSLSPPEVEETEVIK